MRASRCRAKSRSSASSARITAPASSRRERVARAVQASKHLPCRILRPPRRPTDRHYGARQHRAGKHLCCWGRGREVATNAPPRGSENRTIGPDEETIPGRPAQDPRHRREPVAARSYGRQAANQIHIERLSQVIGPAVDARLAFRRDACVAPRRRQSACPAGSIQKRVAEGIVVEESVDIGPPNPSRRSHRAVNDRLTLRLPAESPQTVQRRSGTSVSPM